MMADLSNVACLDQVDIIIGLVALYYGWKVLQACWKDGVIKGKGPLAPLTVLCIASVK